MFGDPESQDAAATRIMTRAETIRFRALRLQQDVAALEWHSSAAAQFRARAESCVRRLVAAAAELEECALLLRQHAARVRARIAEIERDVQQWFTSRARDIASAATTVAGAAEVVTGLLTIPLRSAGLAARSPWHEWPWRPGRLPAGGDWQWLAAADDLRRRGVRI